RLVARGGAVRPGARVAVRVVLDAPLAARGGDRFVLRTASPVATVGGGIITDPAPPRRRVSPFPEAGASARQRLRWMVEEVSATGVDIQTLPIRLGFPAAECADVVATLASEVVQVGGVLCQRARLEAAHDALLSALDEGHAARPLDRGLPLAPLRARLGLGAALTERVVQRAVEAGAVVVAGGVAARAGWEPKLTPADQSAIQSIEQHLAKVGREAPTADELSAIAGPRTPALLRLLEREGRVVPIGEQRFIAPDAWRAALIALREGTQEDRLYSAGELREIIGVSRKFSIPLIEGCDRLGVSSRQGDGRRFHWRALPQAAAAFLDSTAERP
ncbi:MAG: SelB C-terminal domain-containing protein, partial [Gemmatimonadetes bacterium]|nr:SelB C-terminal domain-containing protein [Gemmatimonadota bacterium]